MMASRSRAIERVPTALPPIIALYRGIAQLRLERARFDFTRDPTDPTVRAAVSAPPAWDAQPPWTVTMACAGEINDLAARAAFLGLSKMYALLSFALPGSIVRFDDTAGVAAPAGTLASYYVRVTGVLNQEIAAKWPEAETEQSEPSPGDPNTAFEVEVAIREAGDPEWGYTTQPARPPGFEEVDVLAETDVDRLLTYLVAADIAARLVEIAA
jgi:hypothetical protein